MPILTDSGKSIDALLGQKDLVLNVTMADLFNNKEDKHHKFKTLNICENLNGVVTDGVTQEELANGKSDPVMRLIFSSDESLDNLIGQLTELRKAEVIFKRYTYQQVLDETIEYYSQDPARLRSVNDEESCAYFQSSTGNMCAVGRYLKDSKKYSDEVIHEINLHDLMMHIQTEEDVYEEDVFEHAFTESAAHLTDFVFWDNLQMLHDNGSNWDFKNNCLSDKGDHIYKRLSKIVQQLDNEMKAKCEVCFGQGFVLAYNNEYLPCTNCEE